MYKSPIELIINQCQERFVEEQENKIVTYIQHHFVNVDKEELIKALQYDRGQYSKGFNDGFIELAERLCKDRVSNDPVVIAVKAELAERGGFYV